MFKCRYALLICFIVCFNAISAKRTDAYKTESFDIYHAKAMAFAYNDFATKAKNSECFVVSVSHSKNEMTISFFFQDGIKVNGDKITFGVDEEEIANCGSSISYFFDNRGVFLRQSYNA